MGHGYDGAFVLAEMLLQPLYGLCVKMVGRLIEKKHVRLLKKQPAQSHTTPLSTGKIRHKCIRRRALQRVHSPFELRVNLPAAKMLYFFREFSLPLDESVHLLVRHGFAELHVHLLIFLQDIHNFLHALLYHFKHRLVRLHLRFLLEVAHGIARSPHDLALILLLNAGDDFHQRRLSGSVKTDDADLCTIEE